MTYKKKGRATTCKKCGNEVEEGMIEIIETPNFEFVFCLECAVDIEGWLEEKLK